MNNLFNKFFNEHIIKAIFSNPRKLSLDKLSKVEIRPITIRGTLLYQITCHKENKDFHQNVSKDECLKIICEDLCTYFKQAYLFTEKQDYQLFINKKTEIHLKSFPPTKTCKNDLHNLPKKYLLSENTPLNFLVELQIMNPKGKILPNKMAKFRQINRFLEIVKDALNCFKDLSQLHIVDFGCGKAYLTFSLYFYLTSILGLSVKMVGIDLKQDVIEECRLIAKKCGFTGLYFETGEIDNYQTKEKVDLVIALHACDTATDHAIAKGISWNAKAILAAPCCQHELFNQLSSDSLDALLQYGIIRERLASLVTDAARAQCLEISGYKTQLLEFIDSEHTPKNILIRATKGNSSEAKEKAKQNFLNLKLALKISPTIENVVKKFLNL